MEQLNCIGCGEKGCDGKAGCSWYDSKMERESIQKIRANYPTLNPNDYKCPYCGEMTTAGTFHASCYGNN